MLPTFLKVLKQKMHKGFQYLDPRKKDKQGKMEYPKNQACSGFWVNKEKFFNYFLHTFCFIAMRIKSTQFNELLKY